MTHDQTFMREKLLSSDTITKSSFEVWWNRERILVSYLASCCLPDEALWLNSCRDQQQSLALVWFMLHSPYSQHIFQNPFGGRRVSWHPFLTSLWIVLASMGSSCKILCPSKFLFHINFSPCHELSSRVLFAAWINWLTYSVKFIESFEILLCIARAHCVLTDRLLKIWNDPSNFEWTKWPSRSQIQNLCQWNCWTDDSGWSCCNFRTRQVDDFTSRLLEIHRKMMEINKEEVIF